MGTGSDTSFRIGRGIGYDTRTDDVDYCHTTDGLVRFRDMIYVSNINELKKVILREFHVKPYSIHPSYHKTLTAVNRFYYWPNLKKDVAASLWLDAWTVNR